MAGGSLCSVPREQVQGHAGSPAEAAKGLRGLKGRVDSEQLGSPGLITHPGALPTGCPWAGVEASAELGKLL